MVVVESTRFPHPIGKANDVMTSNERAGFSSTFHRLVFSNLLAQAAEQIGLAAAPLVAVLVLHAGASATALLQAATTLPFLLFSLPAGLLADRKSRSGVMAGGEAIRAGSLVAMLALLATGRLTLPALIVLGTLGTMGAIAYSAAAPSLVTALVPHTHLTRANGRIELARSIAFAAGPAIAGALVGWIGPAMAYTLAGGLSAVAALALAGMPADRRLAPPRGRFRDELRAGVRFTAAHPLLRPIVLTAVVFNFAWYCLLAVFVAYAVRTMGLSATSVGVVLAANGVGMLAGALLAPAVLARVRFGAAITIGPLGGLLAAVVMVATLAVHSGALAAASFFLLGAGPIIWTITTTTLRQAVTPPRMLGRVSAVIMTGTAGARPAGAGIAAVVAALGGEGWCIGIAALGFLLQALIILRSPAAAIGEQPAMPAPDLAPSRGQ